MVRHMYAIPNLIDTKAMEAKALTDSSDGTYVIVHDHAIQAQGVDGNGDPITSRMVCRDTCKVYHSNSFLGFVNDAVAIAGMHDETKWPHDENSEDWCDGCKAPSIPTIPPMINA